MRHRRFRPALRVGEGRAGAALLAAHHLPELLEIVQHRHAFELLLEIRGQPVVGRALVAELGVAERLAVAVRDLDAVEDVAEGEGRTVGHVGVPALARVRDAQRPAVLDDIGEDHHLGDAGLLVHAGDVDFQLAPQRAEVLQVLRAQLLTRVAQHAVLAQCAVGEVEFLFGQRLRKVEPLEGRAQGLPARNDFHVHLTRLTAATFRFPPHPAPVGG
jgi:hypothetical protein